MRFCRCRVGEVVIAAAAERERNREPLHLLGQEVAVVPFDASAAVAYGPVRWATPHRRRRNALDRVIAAHALAPGVTLVTNHPADVQAFPGQCLENWVA